MTNATYAVHPTPIGEALLVTTEAGLAALSVLDGPAYAEVARLSMLLHAVPIEDEGPSAAVAAELDEYFAGERREFTVPLDWGLTAGFTRRALEAIVDVPYGRRRRTPRWRSRPARRGRIARWGPRALALPGRSCCRPTE